MIHKVVDVETVGHVPCQLEAAVSLWEVGGDGDLQTAKCQQIPVNEVDVWHLQRFAGVTLRYDELSLEVGSRDVPGRKGACDVAQCRHGVALTSDQQKHT